MNDSKHSVVVLGSWLFAIATILTIIGSIFIYSSSSIFALEKYGHSTYFLRRQLMYLMPAFAGFFFCYMIPLSLWKKCAPYLFFFSVFLTALTLMPSVGLKIHGSHRWIVLGPIGFQPSEILKFSLFLYLGFFLERKSSKIHSLVHSYVPFLLILAVCFFVLLKQPDFGSALTIFATACLLFFIAEFKIIHLLVTIGCAIPLIIAAILTQRYRLKRILIFLDPWSDPQGRGYQIIQSLIAIGSGGLWGLGIGHSKQKFFYLPMQHTDFIFSIIAEETGLVGTLIVIGLFLLFCILGLKIVAGLSDQFAFYTCLGFVILITLHAAINIMVVSGMVPTKGLGLPFVSYGGTALVMYWCMMGIIINGARSGR